MENQSDVVSVSESSTIDKKNPQAELAMSKKKIKVLKQALKDEITTSKDLRRQLSESEDQKGKLKQ